MKVLTLHRPWADLVARGHKVVETRSWAAQRLAGQRIAIHAAYSGTASQSDPVWAAAAALEPDLVFPGPSDGWGSILATARLVDCVRTERVEWMPGPFAGDVAGELVEWARFGRSDPLGARVAETQRPFGDFTPGRWAWLLDGVERLPCPVRFKGGQGLTREWDG